MFTVDYTDSYISDDPAQHKQSHVLELTSGPYKGCIVALPNNRVRVTNPAAMGSWRRTTRLCTVTVGTLRRTTR